MPKAFGRTPSLGMAVLAREIYIQPDGRIHILIDSCVGGWLHNYQGTVESVLEDFPSIPFYSTDSVGNKILMV